MKRFFLFTLCLSALFSCCPCAMNGPKVVAHRGFWKCEAGAKNSIASLNNAAKIKAWGSEFDVWISGDDSLVVTHDSKHHGLPVKSTPLADLRQHKLDNGETLSSMDQYLQQALEWPELHLVFEIKTPSVTDSLYEARMVPACAKIVKKYGVEKRTTFIAFSLSACEAIARLMPECNVQYLNGDLSPKEVYERGINGIDYHYKVLRQHPEWVKEAQELGMTVNCWTVNSAADIEEMIALGVDQITTDEPTLAQKIIKKSR